MQWQNHKIKVSVAAQTLSHSVSAAITFLRNLKLPQFKDSKATSDFILLINDVFDILNSKSKFGKNYKKPISQENILDVEAYLMNGMETLKSWGEWPSGLYSLRQVTEVKLGRVRSDFGWVTTEA